VDRKELISLSGARAKAVKEALPVWFKSTRLLMGLDQREFGELLELSQSSVARIEGGHQQVTAIQLATLQGLIRVQVQVVDPGGLK